MDKLQSLLKAKLNFISYENDSAACI